MPRNTLSISDSLFQFRTVFILTPILLLISCQQTPADQSVTEDPWAPMAEILSMIEAPEFPDQNFSILDYGAKANDAADDLPAILQAIATCHNKGGGRVEIPEGEYLLRSRKRRICLG